MWDKYSCVYRDKDQEEQVLITPVFGITMILESSLDTQTGLIQSGLQVHGLVGGITLIIQKYFGKSSLQRSFLVCFLTIAQWIMGT